MADSKDPDQTHFVASDLSTLFDQACRPDRLWQTPAQEKCE